MKRLSWRVIGLLVGVLALHLLALHGWLTPQTVAGQGAWRVQPSSPRLKVRVTLATASLAPVAAVEHRVPTRPGAAADLVTVSAQSGQPLPKIGQDKLWSPSPSDYLSIEQVDAYPRPVTDWDLNLAQVPTAQAWLVTVRLWVSAAGQIDHVDVLDAHPQGPWISSLLAPLTHTEVVPAMLAGQAVPVTFVVQLAPDQLP